MTAVDRPDNGQDERRWRVTNLVARDTGETLVTDGDLVVGYFHRREDAERAVAAVNASGRAGDGEQQRDECSVSCDRRVCEWCPGYDRHEGVARWLYDTFGLESAAWAVAGKGIRNYFRGRADELLALLGGPQPDGEVRQHRMDADCWCGPVQADNGAWDHQ